MKTRQLFTTFAAAVLVVSGIAITPAAAASKPGAPRTFAGAATGTSGGVSFTWTAPSSNGGSAITDYGIAASVDGGVTWAATVWLGSTAFSADSTQTPALTCTNVGPGSTALGCRYRAYARNAVGISAASAVIKLWQPPSAPRTLTGNPTDSTYATVTLNWLAPATTGGFTPINYTVEVSTDGAAATTVATTTSLTSVPACTGARSCAYDVRASTAAGTSAASNLLTITTAPGLVPSLTAASTGTDLGAGSASVAVRWFASTIGMAPDHYDFQSCAALTGSLTPCATDVKFTPSTPETVATGANPLTTTRTCGPSASELATCYYRVRSVNARGGVGAWRTVDVQPWAPFNVHATPGPTVGKVTVTFGGPSESGPGPKTGTTQKLYRLYRCTAADCTAANAWTDTGVTAAYPPAAPSSPLPSGAGPYLLGVTDCAANTSCSYRAVFTDGEVPANLPSVPTASTAAVGAALTLATPVNGSVLQVPTFSGNCTLGEGTVTISLVGASTRTITTSCSAGATYSVGTSPALVDGAYFGVATQHSGYITSAPDGFRIDTVAPTVTITTPADNAIVNTTSTTISGTCETGASAVSIGLLGPSSGTLSASCAAGAWSTSTALADGAYLASASQTDTAGNTGSSAITHFTVDTLAPVVTVTAPTANQYLTTHTPTAAGACETASGTVSITLTNTSTNAVTSCSAAPKSP